MTLVSILTPSFNQGDWLRQNLASVRYQGYELFEHLIVDGGSTDSTLEFLKSIRDSRVSWISERDKGQSDALNKGLAKSSGEIVAWLNSDDTFADRRTLEWVVEAFQEDPDLDVVYGHVLDIAADGTVLRVTWSPPLWVKNLNSDINPLKQPATFFRRRVISSTFLDDSLHYAMDHELFIRILRSGAKVKRINKILATNRHHLERKSASRPVGYWEEYELVRSRYRRAPQVIADALSLAVYLPCRFWGTKPLLELEKRVKLAFPAKLPNKVERLRFQLATRTERYVSGHYPST